MLARANAHVQANFANRAGRGLGSGSSEREVQTQQEAHELAFYLFHNLRQSRKRWVAFCSAQEAGICWIGLLLGTFLCTT